MEKTLFNSAERRGLAKGMEEGLAKGLEEGLAKGLEEGLAKGLEEGEKKKQQEIARKMKSKGFSTKDITDLTSLTAEEVDSL